MRSIYFSVLLTLLSVTSFSCSTSSSNGSSTTVVKSKVITPSVDSQNKDPVRRLLYTSKSDGKPVMELSLACNYSSVTKNLGACSALKTLPDNAGILIALSDNIDLSTNPNYESEAISMDGVNRSFDVTYVNNMDKKERDLKVLETSALQPCDKGCPVTKIPRDKHPDVKYAIITLPGTVAKIGLNPGLEVSIGFAAK